MLFFGWLGGIPSTLVGQWVWQRLRLRRGGQSYVNVSVEEKWVTFEGKEKTENISVQSILEGLSEGLRAGTESPSPDANSETDVTTG